MRRKKTLPGKRTPCFVKLLDFGLARSRVFSRITEPGMVMGTVSWVL
ncbi:MAG: hypothetical protein JSV88_27065 [Candidatus Aminicenantes bacterium]|nr:MAG: hypothetical protein JSV88_27065 [Candidatus Aminicenantes bacterium]